MVLENSGTKEVSNLEYNICLHDILYNKQLHIYTNINQLLN